jgi:hypothetical protein
VEFDITPQPSEDERAAIEAALADERKPEREPSPWRETVLPEAKTE